MAVTIKRVAAGLFAVQIETVAGTATYDFEDFKTPCRLLWAQGLKVGGAGGASDTITLQRNDGTAVAISDAADFNVADNTIVNFATLDDAEMDFDNGDILRVVTASGAVGRVTALFAEFQATP